MMMGEAGGEIEGATMGSRGELLTRDFMTCVGLLQRARLGLTQPQLFQLISWSTVLKQSRLPVFEINGTLRWTVKIS